MLFLLIGSVSATDINTNDTQTVSASGNDEILSVGNDVDILGDGEYNYTYLRQQINSGGDITLIKGNYTYADGDGETIEITTSRVIDGNGAVIDMAGLGHRAFYVTASGVTIKNLTIKNANYNGNGGAIYFSKSGTVENCNFTNNKATDDYSYGGAISMYSGSVTNCNFTNNTASYRGGAVYFLNQGNVTNCNFTNNKATGSNSWGGAIYMSSGSVENCNFTDNEAYNGGAVYFFDTGEVKNCNFTNNTATNGGAIFFAYSDNPRTVTNCNFTNNKASGGTGGAIIMGSGSVTNCNFTNNKATGSNSWGGAVYFSNTGNVTNCNFTNNTAKNQGGAIRFSSTGTVKNCNFTANTLSGTDSWGGAIHFHQEGTVENCNFNANTITVGYLGGAVYFNEEGAVTNCNFTGNTATDGGAIRMSSGTVTNCNFTNNKASGGSGGAINMGSGSVTNCNFTNNTASYSGGAVYFLNQGNVTNCNFTNNTAKNQGGAVYFSNTGDVTNCNFTANTATEAGGAIRMSSGTVTNCNFTANTATEAGGAVYFLNQGNVTNCNFTNNTAKNQGGAIRFSSTGTVKNCNFTNNTASYSGGAVYFLNQGNVTNCNFTGNTATGSNTWGGAIRMNSGTVSNCNFTNNTAKYGGAISMSSGSVTNCNFTNNSAVYGGAIRMTSGSVENCNFTNNKATGDYSYGGAISMYSGSVTNCNFSGNTADGDGGAVYFNDEGNVSNCNFTGNNATTGSAIYFYTTSATKTISNSIFLNNRANSEALEVIKNENNITITFTGNDNLLNAIYSPDDVSFTNVTYWGANGIANTGSSSITPSRSNKEAGQNITVSIVINNEIVSNEVYVTDKNGRIVLNRNVGDNYFIGVRHYTDSYYTEKINTTSNNTKFNVNVTSQTTNNKTVNITAKSNIPNEVIKGKLLFILPNSTEINATYASNGTWWALHRFDDAGDYNINATYIGLDDVIINNATIRIMNVIPINTSDISISFGDIANVIVYVPETINGQNITITVNKTSKNATVKNGEAKANFTNLPAGEHLITADYLGDDYNCANSTNATLTVSKRPTEISLKNKTIDLFVKSSIETGATLIPADAGNLTYTVNNPSVAIVENGKIKGINQGKTNITVSFAGNENYTAAENKTIAVTVNLNDASITVNNETLNLKIGQNFTIIANTTPEGINVTYVQDDSGVYIVDKNGVVTALKNGTGSVLVKIDGDGVYAENSTIVNVTVTKVPTEIKVTNTTIDLKVDGEIETGATLIPADAGNLTYKSSDENVAIVKDGKIIALKEGNTIITVSTVSFKGNNKYAAAENKTINVTVSLNDASAKVNNNTLNLLVEDTLNLNATTEPKDLTVNYTSTNPSVVTVDNKGNVMAVSEGNATITVTVGGDGKYAENSTTVTVTVKKVPTEITVDPASLDMFVDDETVIAANLTPPEAGNVSFTSSDENIVTVDNQGNIIAEGKGQAIITVSFAGDNKYAAAENKTITVNVSLNDASVTVDNDTLDLKVDGTYKINATKHPDTILLDITYTSSDETVATVDEKGIVTAVGEGTAIITLSVGDDEIYAKNSTTVTVTVSKIPTEITIANATITLNVDDEVSTDAALNPEKAGNLTYKSSDENVAIVKDGKIIALKEGNTIITVSLKETTSMPQQKIKQLK